MKTEYQILWIDDEMDSVEEDIDAVSNFLAKYGIVARIQQVEPSGDGGIHDEISDIIQNPDLDLIAVDYLMTGMDGKVLIDLIRKSDHVFLPVVFYSSAGVTKLAAAASEAQLDGVYLAPRDGVRNKIELVVTSLLKKEQTSKRTRGLLMEGVSEIDARLFSVLERIWQKSDEESKRKLIGYFAAKVKEISEKSDEANKQFPTTESEFWVHVSSVFVSGRYDTVTRWKVIKKGLALVNVDKALRSVFDELYESQSEPLIRLRNNYAHKTRKQLEESHNEELCTHIRKELHRQTDNVVSIIDYLQ